jgi:hypothetical protein
MRNKKRLPIFIVIELIITVFMIIDHNWYAALGWALLMFTNTDIYMEYLENKTKNGNNNK